MLNYTKENLIELGAEITTREIYQQCSVWQDTFKNYETNLDSINNFLKDIETKHDYIKVILTGAGSSAYVGDSLVAYFKNIYDERKWNFSAIATTDIVAKPEYYLKKDIATVLVSFARSGNSPESVATVNLAQDLVKDLYQITITCAKNGKLAKKAENDKKNLLLLQPELSNDKGFAMTSSFSSMMLTALLIFDKNSLEVKREKFNNLILSVEKVLAGVENIENLVNEDFERVIYLGCSEFFGIAHETQLKILELTAGKIATMYESPLGFRHGPKSFINNNTIIIMFGAENSYTKKYDLDLIKEVAGDNIAKKVIYLSDEIHKLENVQEVAISELKKLEDVYRNFAYLVYGQLFGLLTAIKIKNKPDTPSPTGTVNRVVKGVIIHKYEK